MLPFAAVFLGAASLLAQDAPPAGFTPLFNGKDLGGWRVPAGDNGHWRVVDGVIDYDAGSEAAGEKHLWTEKEYGDFTLRVDWRIKETPYTNPNVHIVKPDGSTCRVIAGVKVIGSIVEVNVECRRSNVEY